MKLYEELEKRYICNEPIILKDLELPTMTKAAIRQSLKRLVDKELIKRHSTGVYYLPKNTKFGYSNLSTESIIIEKYLEDDQGVCGFYTGLKLLNECMLTTQVPNTVEVITSKEKSRKRVVQIGKRSVILRKSRMQVSSKNLPAMKLLELLKYKEFMELDLAKKRVVLKIIGFDFNTIVTLKQLMKAYPATISQRLIESGVLYDFTYSYRVI